VLNHPLKDRGDENLPMPISRTRITTNAKPIEAFTPSPSRSHVIT